MILGRAGGGSVDLHDGVATVGSNTLIQLGRIDETTFQGAVVVIRVPAASLRKWFVT